MNKYEIITSEIIKKLKSGNIIWKKPYSNIGLPRNYDSGRTYSGINKLLLDSLNFPDNRFITFKSIRQKGHYVIKDQLKKKMMAVATIPKWNDDSDPLEDAPDYWGVFYHYVYNVSQTTLWDDIRNETKTFHQSLLNTNDFLNNLPFDYELVDSRTPCFYAKSGKVGMPPISNFSDENEYFASLIHELIHKAGSYIKIKGVENDDYNNSYSLEELIAEIGAMFLCHEAGINPSNLIENQEAYIIGWSKQLESNPKWIYFASNQAEKRVAWMLNKTDLNGKPLKK